jgi:hypothetical protein
VEKRGESVCEYTVDNYVLGHVDFLVRGKGSDFYALAVYNQPSSTGCVQILLRYYLDWCQLVTRGMRESSLSHHSKENRSEIMNSELEDHAQASPKKKNRSVSVSSYAVVLG